MDCERVVSTVICSFEYKNNGEKDYYLFKRDSPLEGEINSPIIYVYSNGYPMKYKGIIVHRQEPSMDDFVLLRAGKSITASIRLTDVFDFTQNTIYTVQYNKPVEYIEKGSMMELRKNGIRAFRATAVFKADTFLLYNVGSLSKPDIAIGYESDEDTDEEDYEDDDITGQSCGSAKVTGGKSIQRNDTLELHQDLCNNLNMAKERIQQPYKLYRKWFGSPKKEYVEHVEDAFKTILHWLKSTKVHYMIKNDCKKGWIAYILKESEDGKGVIALCKPFFGIKEMYCTKDHYKQTREGVAVNLMVQASKHAYNMMQNPRYTAWLAWYLPMIAIKNAKNYELFYCDAQEP